MLLVEATEEVLTGFNGHGTVSLMKADGSPVAVAVQWFDPATGRGEAFEFELQ